MLFENIIDSECIEVQEPTTVEALGFIDDDIVFQKEKILKCYGDTYEIHHGTSNKYPDEYKGTNIYGTFSHGVFVDAWFKMYEKEQIEFFSQKMHSYINNNILLKALNNHD